MMFPADGGLFFICGPCVIESYQFVMETAEQLKRIFDRIGARFVFKASYDKANRSAGDSYRGIGIDKGLQALSDVREKLGIPVLTDVHDTSQIAIVAPVVDILQTPAFLCRQTDFIRAVAQSGKPVNIKKGQFLSPWEMRNVIQKARNAAVEAGLDTDTRFAVCERGTMFGYHNLVVDMRGLSILASTTGCPVVFDATHSVQLPGQHGDRSGGQREFVPILARAAVATGAVAGVFMEVHPDPDQALCDGPNSWPIHQLGSLIEQLMALFQLVREV
jgi:2-dehydro-3-deoxyphosphooctonate aldolase (KDO 8-P synthase)